MTTHDEIPGLAFVTNTPMKNAFGKPPRFLGTEAEAVAYIQRDNFPEIPVDAFRAVRNPYQAFTWAVYVEDAYRLNVEAWVASIQSRIDMMLKAHGEATR